MTIRYFENVLSEVAVMIRACVCMLTHMLVTGMRVVFTNNTPLRRALTNYVCCSDGGTNTRAHSRTHLHLRLWLSGH